MGMYIKLSAIVLSLKIPGNTYTKCICSQCPGIFPCSSNHSPSGTQFLSLPGHIHQSYTHRNHPKIEDFFKILNLSSILPPPPSKKSQNLRRSCLYDMINNNYLDILALFQLGTFMGVCALILLTLQ